VVRRALGRGLEALIPAAVETEVPILPETPEAAGPGASPSPDVQPNESRPIDPRTGDPKALARAVTALVGAPPDSRPAESRPGDIQHVPLSRITRNPAQPRTQFDPSTIKELADSIRERGVLQPVLLRPANGGYQLVAGERRFLATREAGFSTIPAIIRPLTDRESLLIALIENLQRENLNPIDEARAYYRLATEYGLQHDEIGARVGKDRSTVSNIIRFNNLPPHVQTLLESGRISGGHARALLALADAKHQVDIATSAADHGWSVRELEERIKRSAPSEKVSRARRAPKRAFSGELMALEDELMRLMGSRVRITRRRGGTGSVQIDYHSEEELERIVGLLRHTASAQV
jgi:ParB family transcriptional regulator, chromosome partitioning protein